MLNFFKNLISGIGITGGQAILALLLPIFLGIIFKPKEASKIICAIFDKGGIAMSFFLNNKLSKPVGNIIEKFVIKVIVYCLMVPMYVFIGAFRRDNKVDLKNKIEYAKTSAVNLIIK